jgi:hypothetical protein
VTPAAISIITRPIWWFDEIGVATKEAIYRFKLQTSEDVEQGATVLALFRDPSIDGQTPMAYATNIGLGRMADTSNLTYQELSTSAANFIRQSLRSAVPVRVPLRAPLSQCPKQSGNRALRVSPSEALQ